MVDGHENISLQKTMEQYAEAINLMQFRNLHSEVLQQQGIASSFVLVTEQFDNERNTAKIEIQDGQSNQRLTVTPREYRWFQSRAPHTHDYLRLHSQRG